MHRHGPHDLLTELLAGRSPRPDDSPALVEAAADGDRAAIAALASQPDQLSLAFACGWAPLLASPLAAALMPGHEPTDQARQLPGLVQALPAAPLYPRDLLIRLLRLLPAAPREVAAAAAHLEGLYAQLPDDTDPDLAAALALPQSLGAVLDLRTLAFEAGAPLDTAAPSATTPLLLLLDTAGVRTTWQLLDASVPAGLPGDTLASIAAGLSQLGAYATATRLAAVALAAAPGQAQARKTLAGLLAAGRGRVPDAQVGRLQSLVAA